VGESGKGGGGLETACLEGTRQTGEEAEVRKRQRGAATETPEPRPGGDGMQTGQRQQSSRDGNQQHEPAVTRKSSNELHEQLQHGTGPRMPGGARNPYPVVSTAQYLHPNSRVEPCPSTAADGAMLSETGFSQGSGRD
jgi:hypothetical protein